MSSPFRETFVENFTVAFSPSMCPARAVKVKDVFEDSVTSTQSLEKGSGTTLQEVFVRIAPLHSIGKGKNSEGLALSSVIASSADTSRTDSGIEY